LVCTPPAILNALSGPALSVPAVLTFKHFQPVDLRDTHAAVSGLPVVEGLFTDVCLAVNFGEIHAGFLLLQDLSNDPFWGKSLCFSHVEFSHSSV